MEELTLEQIKEKIDIISLAENYGFEFGKAQGVRLRAKINLLRDEKTSSLDFFTDSQKYYDRGTGEGGDAIDLIQAMDNLTQKEAIAKAKEISGCESYQVQRHDAQPLARVKEKKEVDFGKLAYSAQKELARGSAFSPRIVTLDMTDGNGYLKQSREEIFIHSDFEKLFETSRLGVEYLEKMNYLFKHVLGFSDFWKSPSIVIKDRNGKVVDLVAYRPKDKETGLEINGMKYYYKNFLDRGEDFVYPFETLVQRIASKEKYIVVGEGLKNAVNALIYNVPYITIESTGNVLNVSEALIREINVFLEKGYGLATAFDGDKAGEEAYNKFLSLTGFVAKNIFSFDSGVDFVEYVRGSGK